MPDVMNLLPTRPVLPETTVRTFTHEILGISPRMVTFPKSQGQMHGIIQLSFDEEELSQMLTRRKIVLRPNESQDSLVLRVAAKGLQRHKMENEAAVYLWLTQNTSIPVPQIVHHDSSPDNELEHEYMLMTHVLGEDGVGLYNTMSARQMDYVLDQLADHFVQLSRFPFAHVGGLRVGPGGEIVPGPVVDEVQWSEPDIVTYFPPGTLSSDINPSSVDGYPSYTAFLTAYMECYLHAIRIHPALEILPYLQSENISALQRFINTVNHSPLQDKLNDIPYILAHRDLHFGQLLLNPETCQITAVLDWEFTQITPFPLWKRGFLWHGDPAVPWSREVFEERKKLRSRWKERIKARGDGGEGVRALKAQKWKYQEQKAAWDVVNYVRCIVEVTPRSVQADDARGWWDEVVKALKVLGIENSNVAAKD